MSRCFIFLTCLLAFCAARPKPACDISESKAQDAEDVVLVDLFFRDVFGGFFVESGALDGILFSNTYYLEHCLGWQGILIEASPKNWPNLQNNMARRPRCIAHKTAMCCKPRKSVTFIHSGHPAMGGIAESLPKSHGRDGSEEVPCAPFADIIRPVRHVDLWSLDVEGGEFEALMSVDWSEVQIDVLIVEMNSDSPGKNWKVRRLLANVGYVECRWGTIKRSSLFVSTKSPYSCRAVGEQRCMCSWDDCDHCANVHAQNASSGYCVRP